MPLRDKIKIAILKQLLEKGIFDTKKLINIDMKSGILTVSDIRSIVLGTIDFAVLHEAVEKLSGHAGPAILRTQGEESGRIDTKTWLKNLGSFNLKFDPRTIFSMFPAIYTSLGWGKINATEINNETGEGTLFVENCFEADAVLELSGKKDKPQCYFVEGYLKGFFSEITGKKFQVTETRCKATGAEHCEFTLTTK